MGNRLGLVLYCLRRAGVETGSVSTDRQLLERFLGQRDEAAFESLVQRHGPMVLGVCRRLLDDPADVDDAFQATFLVLIRRARALDWRDSLGGWLHQVARRVAMRARGRQARNRVTQRETDAMQIIDHRSPDTDQQDLWRLLDEELDRLPTRFRDLLVLCHLQGKTHEEAARELGCPRGSMDRLLTQAEGRLRDRLVSRGITLSGGVAAALLAEQTASAAVPAALVSGTLRTAALAAAGQAGIASSVAGLAEGVVQAMVWNKIMKNSLLAVLVFGLLAGGLGLFWQAGHAADAVEGTPAAAPAKPTIIRPYVVWSGPHSQVGQTSYSRVTTAEDWRNLWQQHRAGEAPQVDFEQCMVLAIYQGATQNCKGIKVTSVLDEKDKLTVRFVGEWYQTGDTADAVTPYGLFLLPKSAKPVVIEENVQSLIGQAPVWKLRAQFDAPGAAPKEVAVAAPAVPDVSRKGIEARLKAIAANQDADKPHRQLTRDAATFLLKDGELTLQFMAPAADQNSQNQFRFQIENTQKQLSLQMYKMDVMLEELEQLEKERLAEAVEWRASTLYVRGRLAHSIALYYEYNAQLGEMRRQFPDRDPAKDRGWQLTPADSYKDRDAAKSVKRARDCLVLLAQENPNTPWDAIGKAEAILVEKGLKWEPWPR